MCVCVCVCVCACGVACVGVCAGVCTWWRRWGLISGNNDEVGSTRDGHNPVRLFSRLLSGTLPSKDHRGTFDDELPPTLNVE